jgi:hypothetical protein
MVVAARPRPSKARNIARNLGDFRIPCDSGCKESTKIPWFGKESGWKPMNFARNFREARILARNFTASSLAVRAQKGLRVSFRGAHGRACLQGILQNSLCSRLQCTPLMRGSFKPFNRSRTFLQGGRTDRSRSNPPTAVHRVITDVGAIFLVPE